ncbi:MAG: hypothetical protein Tsb009_03270 [Planctomycetaceae bacterium]
MNSAFEPAWQSVRPAVTIHINFGTGKKITRTLNGNIATYICDYDGTVLDIIPGIYDEKTYLWRLQEAVKLYRWVNSLSEKNRKILLQNYHQQQAKSLRDKKRPLHIAVLPRLPGRSIRGIERGIIYTLQNFSDGGKKPKNAAGKPRRTLPEESSVPTADGKTVRLPLLFGRKALKADVEINESVRRLKVHEYLARHQSFQPKQMTKWLYREVLNTDLDDPYFGLKKLLVDSDPFRKGD